MVRIAEAAAQLGLSDSAICGPRYRPFTQRTDNRKMTYFDLEAYRKKEDTDYEVLEKTKLFIEYLVHEEGITYSEIAKNTGVSFQLVSNHKFASGKAYIISTWYGKYRPYALKRFDQFYGWASGRSLSRVVQFKGLS